MKKTLLVLKNEFISVVTRKSFLLTLVLLPLTSFIILLVVSGIQKGDSGTASLLKNVFQPGSGIIMEGFIDHSGLMSVIPPDITDELSRYDSETAAEKALKEGTIAAYYVIPADFIETGDIICIRPDFNPLGGASSSGPVSTLVAYNLTNGDFNLAARIQNPINASEVDISNQVQRDSGHWLTFFLPYIVTFLFYIVIMTSSSLMLSSVTNEKQNRVMEILMTSITPGQMLTGKIIALGLVGLLQTVIWLGAGLLMLRFSGKAFALGAAFQLPASILLWGILFFIFGYAMYASLMAGIGALVPSLREASQLTTVVILPMIIPLMFINALINTPDSPLATFLSIFPLSAPVSMMTRLAATQVPIWQVLLALALLIFTAWLLVRASASLFKAQNLLTGQTMNALGFIKALTGN
ncbi:MAG TPA: ABC transporter permease [Anaerolineaceae bacterium]|nr:ABC transporter permease [Anaerolineaceae bacterium]